jgi:hypothetical protein
MRLSIFTVGLRVGCYRYCHAERKRDRTTQVLVKLTGTTGDSKLPVHLHLGDTSTPGADVASLLNPINAKTGISETVLSQMADESEIFYSDLIELSACVKIPFPI